MRFPALALLVLFATLNGFSQQINVIGYFMGAPEKVPTLPAEKLTHIIFSFCHLKGNLIGVDNAQDSLALTELVKLKQRNPSLKIMAALGGWGGCQSCSDVFSSDEGRTAFSRSVLALMTAYRLDGIDLDWEYPAIAGYPDHAFKDEDRDNFTALVKSLRETLGSKYEISFAAGGFMNFMKNSIDWPEVMKHVDRVNLMSYDLVHGNSPATGHHTPLFSTPLQDESAHRAIRWMSKNGVPKNKIVLGAAFYARVWENVDSFNNGLYQPGKFKTSVRYHHFSTEITKEGGYEFFTDENAMAPFAYNKKQKLFATFDDKQSISVKTKYAIDQRLNGIMFWELSQDTSKDGLLDAINAVKVAEGARSK